MKLIVQWFKKDPFLTLLIFLIITQLFWFGITPQGFKTAWSNTPPVAEIIKEHELVVQKAKIVAISYYNPDFTYFADIVSGAQMPKKDLMERYYLGKPYIFHTYYQKSVDLLPEIDAAHYLLGFCEYYMGNPDVALEQYEKSLDLNPYFFWSYYNLGVIYFQQGDFYKSAVMLNKSFSLRKEIALEILKQGPFYRQIWRNLANPPQILGSNLSEAQEDAALLLAACLVKARIYDQALQIIQSVGQGSFWHKDLWRQLHHIALNKQSLSDDLIRLLNERITVRLF